ncbi:MAG: leucine-rich repeat domain-containing protein, partial [Duncaniella sp.]|nr:leucine-rich repeat domain-containing protein [Duncaniella sp.]
DLAFCTQTLNIYGKENPNPVSGLKEIILPEGLTKIPEGAFVDCINLTDVTIPSTVTELGEMAFYRSGITRLDAKSVTIVGANACEECRSLQSVVLGDLSRIYSFPFQKCDSLTTFDLTRCTSVPQSQNTVFGHVEMPNLTIYVASQTMMEKLQEPKNGIKVWTSCNPKWAIGPPPTE